MTAPDPGLVGGQRTVGTDPRITAGAQALADELWREGSDEQYHFLLYLCGHAAAVVQAATDRYDGEHGQGGLPAVSEMFVSNAKRLLHDVEVDDSINLTTMLNQLTLNEWAITWFDSLDVAPNTAVQYHSLARNHILPRWGSVNLSDIRTIEVRTWSNELRACGYVTSTVATIIKILSMMLADAVDERLIDVNPVRPNRRGRRRHVSTVERRWTTPERALRIALHATQLVGPWAGILMITAAWTGARWGELTGLQRPNLHLDDGCFVIDPHTGALHEVNGTLTLGPPKTAESARTITLPPFLIPLLQAHLDSHTHPHVFVTAHGELLRRSNFARRAMRPAADGNLDRTHVPLTLPPIEPGLTFHGFRHSHKTWLIADGIPDVAQARRLGHRIPDKIEHIYSHVAPEIETRLLVALQQRWKDSLRTLSIPPLKVTSAWLKCLFEQRALDDHANDSGQNGIVS
jgi:integrase